MKLYRHFGLIMVILAIMALYCFINARIETGPTIGIEIDLSRPFSIVWPCEIDYIDYSFQKGFKIPPNVGRGWLNEAGGSAVYKFFSQMDDEYCIWIYCKWYDECTNAVYISVDDQEKVIVGNDPIYQQWHWVRGFPVRLNKGTHSLTLSNHSDNIEIAKLVLINSEFSGPQDSEVTFSDLFYDGFDGCDEGNFSSWQIVTGQWQVMDPATHACAVNNALKGMSEGEAMIILPGESWQNYSFDMEIKAEVFEPGESEIGVCFGVQDLDHYYMLSFAPQADNASEVTAALTRQIAGKTVLLQSIEIPWLQKEWCRFQIRGNEDTVEFVLDDKEFKTIPLSNQIPANGGIGFHLKGKTIAYFDNIHVRKIIRSKVDH